ncbi:hypothetical protein C8P63_10375 [Melghirimyces profundicolus]|uniref:Fervidolysin-like N-terminal prodomain domain-containing protein n=1 Tax=Melghirimyces profundicolus TaxID=1242148 RepID=A0A2T6C7L8_9BACL|nr:hypothetical protein [Melghirimyces profundicolus]PTX64292.1 hypothetical protein C8P63_10375 [Melghirimyces profundicolus]
MKKSIIKGVFLVGTCVSIPLAGTFTMGSDALAYREPFSPHPRTHAAVNKAPVKNEQGKDVPKRKRIQRQSRIETPPVAPKPEDTVAVQFHRNVSQEDQQKLHRKLNGKVVYRIFDNIVLVKVKQPGEEAIRRYRESALVKQAGAEEPVKNHPEAKEPPLQKPEPEPERRLTDPPDDPVGVPQTEKKKNLIQNLTERLNPFAE